MSKFNIIIPIISNKEKYQFKFYCEQIKGTFSCEIITPKLWDKKSFSQKFNYFFNTKIGTFCIEIKPEIQTVSDLKEYLKIWSVSTVFTIENNTPLEKELEKTCAKDYNEQFKLIHYFEKFYGILTANEVQTRTASTV